MSAKSKRRKRAAARRAAVIVDRPADLAAPVLAFSIPATPLPPLAGVIKIHGCMNPISQLGRGRRGELDSLSMLQTSEAGHGVEKLLDSMRSLALLMEIESYGGAQAA